MITIPQLIAKKGWWGGIKPWSPKPGRLISVWDIRPGEIIQARLSQIADLFDRNLISKARAQKLVDRLGDRL
jgi:hypothetical protein